jgi:hypothetical protein
MQFDNHKNTNKLRDKYKVFFFAGGETDDDKFNVFTGSFIRLMRQILGDDFDYIRGIYFKTPVMNVIWALNNAQRPIVKPGKNRITRAALDQITSEQLSPQTQIVIISSSSGSVVAAQAACYLAEMIISRKLFDKPFHIILGASMIDPRSDLFKKLLQYQNAGIIGTIIHDEIQDEGDTSFGVGGLSRGEAYMNAFRLLLPGKGPSFLNKHPEKGHIHRKRSMTVQKAIDFINIILIKHKLAGDYYKEKAITAIQEIVI